MPSVSNGRNIRSQGCGREVLAQRRITAGMESGGCPASPMGGAGSCCTMERNDLVWCGTTVGMVGGGSPTKPISSVCCR